MLCSFVTAYPFRAPVKLALGDLWYTNPAERDTEHSFLMYFFPNKQAQSQGKTNKPDKYLCWHSLVQPDKLYPAEHLVLSAVQYSSLGPSLCLLPCVQGMAA